MDTTKISPKLVIVNCPITKKAIDINSCFESAMVAENMAPERTGVKEIVTAPDFKERCLACPNHKD